MNLKLFLFPLFLFSFFLASAKTTRPKKEVTLWNLAGFLDGNPGVRVAGNPETKDCKYGKVVEFNGANDGIFLENTPLAGMDNFTIEAIFMPESGGNFEQRFFHSGEIRGDRVLLEIRTTKTDWYFDAYVQSGDQKKALIDPSLLHQLDQWYHVACVVENGRISTYINGKKELEATLVFSPLLTGKTSIGVRLNEQSWFKGALSQIRISPKALKPKDFLNF